MAEQIVRTPKAEKKPAEEKAKQPEIKTAKPSGGSSVGYRIGAAVLWVLALLCEVGAILVLTGSLSLKFIGLEKTAALIVFIVLDFVLAVVAAQLWKKANHINPPSKKNKVVFYLVSELGVIMAVICFLPLIILLLKDKELDKKSKIIVTIVAVVALLIAGVASADFDPISAEEKGSAEHLITTDVYWTAFGRKYHLDEDCQALANSSVLTKGTVKEAIEEGRTSLCAFCAKKHASEFTEEELANLKIEGQKTAEPVKTGNDELVQVTQEAIID